MRFGIENAMQYLLKLSCIVRMWRFPLAVVGSLPTVSRDHLVERFGRSVGNEHGFSGSSSDEFLFEIALPTSNKFRHLISQPGPGVWLPSSPVGFGYALVASYEAAVVFFDYLGPHFRRWNLNLPVAKYDSYVTTPEYFRQNVCHFVLRKRAQKVT